jgi:hypothetical protein
MKRPSAQTYLIGNLPVLIGFAVGTAYAAYQATQGTMSPIVALILAGFTGTSANASSQIEKFNRWNREWNLMEGKVAGFRLPSLPRMRVAGGVVLWLLMASYVTTHGGEPAMQVAAVLFWIGSVILAARGLYLVSRGGVAKTRRTRSVAVTVPLPVARNAGDLRQSYEALPGYCIELFQRER